MPVKSRSTGEKLQIWRICFEGSAQNVVKRVRISAQGQVQLGHFCLIRSADAGLQLIAHVLNVPHQFEVADQVLQLENRFCALRHGLDQIRVASDFSLEFLDESLELF